MKHWSLFALVLGLGVVSLGCGKAGNSEITAQASIPKTVSKWKYHPQSIVGIPKGLVLETQGEKVTGATIYDLKGDTGFVIDSKVSTGAFALKQGRLILPVAMPGGFNIDEWVAAGGLCFEIPYSPSATNLVARLRAPGAPDSPTEFVPFVE